MSFNIEVEGGKSVRLPTAGKYCDRDIVVTAIGGTEDLDAVLTEQEALIAELQAVLAEKASGGGTEDLNDVLTEQEELIATLQEILKSKAAGGGGELPEGYKRCDYIQFNGSNFVDTGIIGNQDTQIFASFTWENSTQRYLLGCAHSDNTAAITAYMNGSWRFGNKVASKSISFKDPMLPYSALLNKTNIAATSGATTISGVNDFETIGSLLFGACRSSNGNYPSTGIVGKGLRLIIWQDGERVLDLVPVTNGEGEYRFWDTIGKKLHDSVTSTPLGGGNL